MNVTLELLRFVGSPFVEETEPINLEIMSNLYECSMNNRMAFLFLERLNNRTDLGSFGAIYEAERKRQVETLQAICRVSKVLSNLGVKHAVFKTLRPYPFTTVDIDVLVFGSQDDFSKAEKSMQKYGFELVYRGPRSTTLLDPSTRLGIDLYQQVAVSFVSYLDKEKLFDHLTTVELQKGDKVSTLTPEADSAVLIAHSMIKEQMYTLSEYYTFLYYAQKLNIQGFRQIANKSNIKFAAKTHAAITVLLHQAAHNTIPKELRRISDMLGSEPLETRLLKERNFKTPHKYHMLTVAKSVLGVMREENCRMSLAWQAIHLLNPSFSRKFIMDLVAHSIRETY